MLNVYFCFSGPYNSNNRMEGWNDINLIVAETRAKAQYIFWKENRWDLGNLTEKWENYKIFLVKKNVDKEWSQNAGIVVKVIGDPADGWWELVGKKWEKLYGKENENIF